MKIRLIFMLLMVCLSKAEAVTLLYICNEDEETATVQGLSSGDNAYNGSIIIPDKIEREFVAGKIVEYKVVGIEPYAFGIGHSSSQLSSITLPDGIVSIGKSAFYGCSNLSSIVLPDNITRIEPSTFSGCSSLSTVILPENLTFIGEGAFYDCESLHSIVFPNKLKTIGVYAFYNSGLRSVLLPEKLAVFEYGSDSGRWGNSFYMCKSLVSIDVVEENPYFTSIDGVLYTKDKHTLCIYPFGRNGELTVPDGVIDIKEFAFYRSEISAVHFPVTLQEIGKLAFANCGELTNLVLPDGIRQLGESAFSDCDGLEDVKLSAELERILAYAFYGCDKLKSIILPSKVTFIGAHAFAIASYNGDEFLKFVYSEAKQPPLMKWAFDSELGPSGEDDDWYYPGTLYVPIGCKDAYQADEAWMRFKKIEEYDPTGNSINDVRKDNAIRYMDGRVYIPNNNELVQMEIYAVSGGLVESCQVIADKGCDITSLPEGTYVVKIMVGNETICSKIRK